MSILSQFDAVAAEGLTMFAGTLRASNYNISDVISVAANWSGCVTTPFSSALTISRINDVVIMDIQGHTELATVSPGASAGNPNIYTTNAPIPAGFRPSSTIGAIIMNVVKSAQNSYTDYCIIGSDGNITIGPPALGTWVNTAIYGWQNGSVKYSTS
jgi:hypothetical protein